MLLHGRKHPTIPLFGLTQDGQGVEEFGDLGEAASDACQRWMKVSAFIGWRQFTLKMVNC